MSDINDPQTNPSHENAPTNEPTPMMDDALSDAIDSALVGESTPAPDRSSFTSAITMKNSPIEPYTGTEPPNYSLKVFGDRDSGIAESIAGFSNIDPSLGEQGKRWLSAVQSAQRNRVAKKLFERDLDRTDTNLLQYVESGANKLYARSTSVRAAEGKLSGERGLLHLRHVMGLGEDREIPLFASGLYLTVRAMPDVDLSNLETHVLNEKEQIGRATGGAGLSATAVYLVKHFANAVFDNMASVNVEIKSPDELLDLILITDIQSMATGQGSTIFTKGYPIEVPCTRNFQECQSVESYNLNLKWLMIHHNNKLTDHQRAHMQNPDRKHSVKAIQEYQAQGPVVISEVVTVADGKLSIDFRTPTLRQYIDDSESWINGIQEMVDTLIDDELSDSRRTAIIDDNARLTTLRQYGHFIKSISITDDKGRTSTIDDRETLLRSVAELSSDEVVLEAVVNGVRRHIENATISVAGVPKIPCPKCQADVQLTEDEKTHPKYIPVDALNLFFTLLQLKLTRRQRTKLQDI